MHCHPWMPNAKFPWSRPGDWLTGTSQRRKCKQLLSKHTSCFQCASPNLSRQLLFTSGRSGEGLTRSSCFHQAGHPTVPYIASSKPAIHIQKQSALLTRHHTILTWRRMLTSDHNCQAQQFHGSQRCCVSLSVLPGFIVCLFVSESWVRTVQWIHEFARDEARAAW